MASTLPLLTSRAGAGAGSSAGGAAVVAAAAGGRGGDRRHAPARRSGKGRSGVVPDRGASSSSAAAGPSNFRRPPTTTTPTPTDPRQKRAPPPPIRLAQPSPFTSSASPGRGRGSGGGGSGRSGLETAFKPPALPKAVWEVVDTLHGAGHPAFLVGGAVRDTLLGRRPKDYDILTTAAPALLCRLFARARVVGARYPITHIPYGAGVHEVSTLLPAVAGMGEVASVEPPPGFPSSSSPRRTARRAAVATLNSGAWPADPVSMQVALEAALLASAHARDFTVNALFLDPRTGHLHDPTGRGVADLASRTLTSVAADPAASFTEDPARMMRAVRLASRTGLALAPRDVAALRACAGALSGLTGGRLALELTALLAHGAAAPALALARAWGLLPRLLPVYADLLDRECGPVGDAAAASLRPPSRLEGMNALAGLDATVVPDRPAPPGVVAAALAMPLLADEVRRFRRGGGSGVAEEWREDYDGEEDSDGGATSLRRDPAALAFNRLVTRAVTALCTPVPCGEGTASPISRSSAGAAASLIRRAVTVPGARARTADSAVLARASSSSLLRYQNVFLVARSLAARVREEVEER